MYLCTLNVNKIDTITYFSKTTCQFLLVCFKVHTNKISDKIEKFFYY